MSPEKTGGCHQSPVQHQPALFQGFPPRRVPLLAQVTPGAHDTLISETGTLQGCCREIRREKYKYGEV